MNYEDMNSLAELMKEITETGVVMRDRINCLKNGLEMISKYGYKFSALDLVEIAKTTLEKYEKLP